MEGFGGRDTFKERRSVSGPARRAGLSVHIGQVLARKRQDLSNLDLYSWAPCTSRYGAPLRRQIASPNPTQVALPSSTVAIENVDIIHDVLHNPRQQSGNRRQQKA